MQVASLELCKTLYELSGWDNQELRWRYKHRNDNNPELVDNPSRHKYGTFLPAYDLGYLLGMLEANVPMLDAIFLDLITGDGENWRAEARYKNGKSASEYDDKPQNAACKLAIELFKQGVLKRD